MSEVSKHPHNTLASLRAQISVVMAYIDKEATPARSSGLGKGLLWRPVGILANKCVGNKHVNLS